MYCSKERRADYLEYGYPKFLMHRRTGRRGLGVVIGRLLLDLLEYSDGAWGDGHATWLSGRDDTGS